MKTVTAQDIRKGDRIHRHGAAVGVVGTNSAREWDSGRYRVRVRIRAVDYSNGRFLTWLADPKDSFKIL